MLQYEFVASALSFVVDPMNFKKYPDVVDAFRKFFILAKSEFKDQRFSILYNAYMEQHDGKEFRKYFNNEELKLYADSGGLQMITLGKEITPEIKDRIYNVQAMSSDYAMIFDEIPAINISNGDDRLNSTSSRLFDATAFDSCAKLTANNIKRQLDVFDSTNSTSKPLLILQGNDTSWYQKWLDICLKELGEDYYNRLSGLAFGTPVYGNGQLEDIERMFWIRDIEGPEHLRKHIHLLGVGSINRFVIPCMLRHSGVLPADVLLSYDSSKLTGGTRRGEYHFNHQSTRFWRDDPVGLEYFESECAKFCKVLDIEFCPKHFNSAILHNNEIRLKSEAGFEDSKIVMSYVTIFLFSAYGFMKTIEHFKNRENIERECKKKELLKLLDITDYSDFKNWANYAKKSIKSDRVMSKDSYNPPSSLSEFF